MKLKKNTIPHLKLFFVFLIILDVWKSKAQIKPIVEKRYTLEQNYKVFEVKSMLFDDYDWLWVSGKSLNTILNKINERESIIQRYDGQRFHDVLLPKFVKKPEQIILQKKKDKNIFATFIWENNILLYEINPKTLEFKEVVFPKSKEIRKLKLFEVRDYFLVYTTIAENTTVYRLNNHLQIHQLSTKPITQRNPRNLPEFNYLIPLKDHFILSEIRSGTFIYNNDGSVLKEIKTTDLGMKNTKLDYFLSIENWFSFDNRIFVSFIDIKDCYEYNPTNKNWKKSLEFEKSNFERLAKQNIFSDNFDNLVIQDFDGEKSKFSFKLKTDDYRAPINNSFNITSKIASRNLQHELCIENKGVFYHYLFNNSKITTFLENCSIRGMLQLNEEEILVTTEFSGWKIINLKTSETKPFETYSNGKPQIIIHSREIFADDRYYWSNNDKGIIWVDKKNAEIKSSIYFPVASMFYEKNDIYYGTYKYHLVQFDKEDKKNKNIFKTAENDVQKILKIGETILLASGEGLLIFEDGKKTLYNPKENTSFFISIINDPFYGILLGTQSGDLYQFNLKNKTFKSLFKDKLNASIASILIDDAQRIWLNTFNGIISFNPKTKETFRLSMNDGLSFYEANRYSALKTTDGKFLIGTLKGVNYFNPNELKKMDEESRFLLTSASFYDENLKETVTHKAPEKLASLRHIFLSPINKNIHLQFSVFGLNNFNKTNYKYRINEDSWIDLKSESELRLQNLSSGTYSLQIQATDGAEKIIGTPLFLEIKVDDFFYNKSWFYVLLILFFGAIGVWYYKEQEKKFELKEQFSSQIIASQEANDSRVAKELHDSIGQRLLVLKNILTQKEPNNSEEINLIKETIDEVRSISHNLHPFQFESLGLQVSLTNMIESFQKSSSILYSYSMDDISDTILKKHELFVFRILQECLSNVEKHSNASICKVTISNKKSHIKFSIKDDGKGFVVETSMNNSTSLGLKSLQERAQFVNAKIEIKSSLHQGTNIIIKVPKK